MTSNDYTKTFEVEKSPEEVFKIIKNVRGWWSGLYDEEFEGDSEKTGDEFTFRAGNGAHYTKQKLTALIPDKKIVWLVTESNLSFLEQPAEWKGTKISFDLSEEKNKTKVVFTHEGLTPQIECYNSCAPAWTQYLEEKFLTLVAKE